MTSICWWRSALRATPPPWGKSRLTSTWKGSSIKRKCFGLVDVVVHHGGTGTVLGAFEAGVPQLILPQGADQFFNADALSRIGAVQAIHNKDQVPGTIRNAVEELLGAGPERQMTRRLQAEIAAMPGPADVVEKVIRYAGGAAPRP